MPVDNGGYILDIRASQAQQVPAYNFQLSRPRPTWPPPPSPGMRAEVRNTPRSRRLNVAVSERRSTAIFGNGPNNSRPSLSACGRRTFAPHPVGVVRRRLKPAVASRSRSRRDAQQVAYSCEQRCVIWIRKGAGALEDISCHWRLATRASMMWVLWEVWPNGGRWDNL